MQGYADFWNAGNYNEPYVLMTNERAGKQTVQLVGQWGVREVF